MYRVYADDPQARINLGIRRRLAPLLRQRPPPHRADERPAVLAARHAGHLLRRRDRHGRQHLPRRPQRRAHADAVERRPQRRLLARQPAAALPAGHHRPRVPLRDGQRRGAAAQPELAAVVDEAADRAAQAAPGVRPRDARVPAAPRTARCSRSCARYERRATSSSSPTCRGSRSTSSSTSRAFKGRVPVELFGAHAVPADRRAALPADARPARVLLVLARAGARAGGAATARGRCRRSRSTGAAWTDVVETARGRQALERALARLPAGAPLVRRQGARIRARRGSGRRSRCPSRGAARNAPPAGVAGAARRRVHRGRPARPTCCRSPPRPTHGRPDEELPTLGDRAR